MTATIVRIAKTPMGLISCLEFVERIRSEDSTISFIFRLKLRHRPDHEINHATQPQCRNPNAYFVFSVEKNLRCTDQQNNLSRQSSRTNLNLRSMKQLKLIKSDLKFHGGEIAIGKRKTRRPLCSKRPIHFVLKAHNKNLFMKRVAIERQIQSLARKIGIKIYGLVVNFDHIHFVSRIHSRRIYNRFIRSLTGILARKFKLKWKLSPFSRVLEWGSSFKMVLRYIEKNRDEVFGLRPYEIRKNYYRRFVSG